MKKALTVEDLYRVKGISGLSVSDDGSLVVFTLETYNVAKGTARTDVYLLDLSKGDSPCRLTRSGDCHSSAVSVISGSPVVFFTRADKRRKTKAPNGDFSSKTQLYAYNLSSGSTRRLTNFSMGVDSPVVSRDGRFIVFSSKVYPDCGADSLANHLRDKRERESPAQAHIADELLYRHWTEWADGKVSHIISYDITDDSYVDLTPGTLPAPIFMLGGGCGFNISPDSKKICFSANFTSNQAESTRCDLYLTPIDHSDLRCITSERPAWDANGVFSPDGKTIAFLSQHEEGYESDLMRLTLYDVATGKNTNAATNIDNQISSICFSPDGQYVYFTMEEHGYRPVCRVSAASPDVAEKLTDGITIREFSVSGDNYALTYTASRVDKPAEIYRMQGSQTTQLTRYNKPITGSLDLRPVEEVWIKTTTGEPIHTFIVKPHGFVEGRKYPLVLNVHGGPQQQWTNAWRGDYQVYAAEGYVTAFCNPHGSTGYGAKFTRQISGDWGGQVFRDLMAVTDYLADLPYVDNDRMGAMGWSFGGYMMNWFQAKTRRFKCLASMMGVYDLRSMWGATEELWFPNFDLCGRPWESRQYEEFSPSAYIAEFATPTLIVTGELDFRVPYTQSLQYFSALRSRGIPARLVVFKNDGHWPNHVKSMPLYYREHLAWFHKWL